MSWKYPKRAVITLKLWPSNNHQRRITFFTSYWLWISETNQSCRLTLVCVCVCDSLSAHLSRWDWPLRIMRLFLPSTCLFLMFPHSKRDFPTSPAVLFSFSCLPESSFWASSSEITSAPKRSCALPHTHMRTTCILSVLWCTEMPQCVRPPGHLTFSLFLSSSPRLSLLIIFSALSLSIYLSFRISAVVWSRLL